MGSSPLAPIHTNFPDSLAHHPLPLDAPLVNMGTVCASLLISIATITALLYGPVFAMSETLDQENFVFVSRGCFEMGDAFSEGPHAGKPVHKVCVSDFYLKKYEVTVGDFRDFVNATRYQSDAERDGGCLSWMGTGWRKYEGVIWKRPGFSQTAHHPVVCITWHDALAYIAWKRAQSGLNYRLPTEAEWEYAARSGGKKIKIQPSKHDADLMQSAWFRNNAEGKTHAVGQKKANALGLHDMSGNVWEWVQDRYHDDYYALSPKNNPKGPDEGKGRVMRGGSWYNPPQGVQATHRNWTHASKRYTSLGFRLALDKKSARLDTDDIPEYLDKTATAP